MLLLECSKADYWGPAFAVPMFSFAFSLALVIVALLKLLRAYRDDDPLLKPILRAVFCVIISISLFCVHFPTLQYGIFLPTTLENDAQCRQGVVTAIAEVPFSPRYAIQNSSETYRGSFVWIDGDVFYFLNAEGLEVGQNVMISYLPRCYMVLSCEIVNS